MQPSAPCDAMLCNFSVLFGISFANRDVISHCEIFVFDFSAEECGDVNPVSIMEALFIFWRLIQLFPMNFGPSCRAADLVKLKG